MPRFVSRGDFDMWGVFTNNTAANAAIARINANKGYPIRPDYVTLTWAVPRQTIDGKAAFELPDARFTTGVGARTEVVKPTWPADTVRGAVKGILK